MTQKRDDGIDGLGLVEEFEIGDAGRVNDLRRGFECHSDEGDLDALEIPHRHRWQEGPAGRGVDHVGGEEREIRAGETVPVLAAIGGMAPAILHAEELEGTVVEFMIADGGEIDPDQVGRLNGRLVVKISRDKGAGADQIASGDDDRVGGLGLEVTEVGGEKIGSAEGIAGDVEGGIDMAVEVVEGENL